MCLHPTRGKERVLSFWCTFSNEDTGGWVRADRMVTYHPSLIKHVVLDKRDPLFEAQSSALQAAQKSFNLMHNGTRRPNPPTPPPDLIREDSPSDDESDLKSEPDVNDDDEMDLGADSSEEDVPSSPPPRRRKSGRQSSSSALKKTPVRPKAKKEPRKTAKRKAVAPATVPRSKRRKAAAADLEEQLMRDEPSETQKRQPAEEQESARSIRRKLSSSKASESPMSRKLQKVQAELEAVNQQNAKLKKTLRRRERELEELNNTSDTAMVTFSPPEQPKAEEIKVPEEKLFRSHPVASERFAAIMKDLHNRFEKFKGSASAVEEAKSTLKVEKEKMAAAYKELAEKVTKAEEEAIKGETEIVTLLKEILLSDVQVMDLRQHKAGNVIRGMGKTCKDLPSIAMFCSQIYVSWKTQVLSFVKTSSNADSSNSDAKSSPEGKVSGKTVVTAPQDENGKEVKKKDAVETKSKGEDDTVVDKKGHVKDNVKEQSEDDGGKVQSDDKIVKEEAAGVGSTEKEDEKSSLDKSPTDKKRQRNNEGMGSKNNKRKKARRDVEEENEGMKREEQREGLRDNTKSVKNEDDNEMKELGTKSGKNNKDGEIVKEKESEVVGAGEEKSKSCMKEEKDGEGGKA